MIRGTAAKLECEVDGGLAVELDEDVLVELCYGIVLISEELLCRTLQTVGIVTRDHGRGKGCNGFWDQQFRSRISVGVHDMSLDSQFKKQP